MFSDGEMSNLGGISISNYIIEDEIGRGTSGRVFKARSRAGGGPTVAIKFIAKKQLSGAAKDNLVNEIRQENASRKERNMTTVASGPGTNSF
jgi:hypothetical protein